MPAMKPVQEKDTNKYGSRPTCSVALKSPNGIVLRLFKKTTQSEASPAGPREFEKYEVDQDHAPITLRGYKGAAFGQVQPFQISGQYAITENVPVDFIQEWFKQNQQLDLVKNNLIFVMPDNNEAAARGADQKHVWDGLNPLKMSSEVSKDPRVPKKVRTLSKKEDDGGETLSRPMPADMLPASASE